MKIHNHARRRIGLALALVGLISAATLATDPISPASVKADAGSWSNTGSLSVAHFVHTATLLSNGKVLVTGGGAGNAYAELYDPQAGTWSLTGSLNIGRSHHTATLLQDGKVLVAGGYNGGAGNAYAELYDPQAGTWSLTGSLNTPRSFHTATLLPDGKVMVAGGLEELGSLLSTAEVYDPATGEWSLAGSINVLRAEHTATLLANGKVLVAGGGTTAQLYEELYDPATGNWSLTGSLNTPRYSPTATLLPDGKILVAGGCGDGDCFFRLSSAELYDPLTGTWSVTGRLNVPRTYHKATLLQNGNVLVAGGFGFDGTINSAELYDPQTGSWSLTGSLNTPREAHTATLLPDGKVLVAGGVNFNDILNSAELYDPGTVNCAAQISPSSQFFSSMGGSGSVNLATGNACSWAVSNNTDWITLTSPASGAGPATVTFEVRENFTASPRSATLVIAGQSFTVVQAGGSGEGCDYSVSARLQTFSAAGGAATINVTTTSQCAWQAVSNTSWITITSNGVGIGNGVVGFTVAANPTGSSRKGTITVAGQTFSVKQKGN